MERVIPISTNTEKFFRQYLTIMRPLLQPHLSNGELNVLAGLLAINNDYKGIKDDIKDKLLLDYDNKIRIIENLGINMQVLNNALMNLRKKNYLIGNRIKDSLIVYPDKNNQITYKLTLTDEV